MGKNKKGFEEKRFKLQSLVSYANKNLSIASSGSINNITSVIMFGAKLSAEAN